MFAAQIFAEGKLRNWEDFFDMGTSETKVASVKGRREELEVHSEITTNKGKYPQVPEEIEVNKYVTEFSKPVLLVAVSDS